MTRARWRSEHTALARIETTGREGLALRGTGIELRAAVTHHRFARVMGWAR